MGLNELIKIGSKIKELRTAKGISQKTMAENLNIPRTTYSNYENDNRVPDMSTLERIASELNVTTNEILGINQKDFDYFANSRIKTSHISEVQNMVYDLYEIVYNSSKLKENIKISAIEFLKKDEYFWGALTQSIVNVVLAEMDIYNYRISNGDNKPIKKDITITYSSHYKTDLNGAEIETADSYILGEKYNNIGYLEFMIKKHSEMISELKEGISNDQPNELSTPATQDDMNNF